jgi:hypothetical protein
MRSIAPSVLRLTASAPCAGGYHAPPPIPWTTKLRDSISSCIASIRIGMADAPRASLRPPAKVLRGEGEDTWVANTLKEEEREETADAASPCQL